MKAKSLVLVCLLASAMNAQSIVNTIGGTFVDISTTGGTQITPIADDSNTNVTTTIGNALFPAGTISIGNNGAVVGAASVYIAYGNGDIPVAPLQPAISLGAGILMPFWDDLYPVAATQIWWQETGGVLYIMWKDENHFPDTVAGNGITFEVQVFSNPGPCTPYIQYLYQDTTFGGTYASADNGAEATIGYAGGTLAGSGVANAKWSFLTASVSPGLVLSVVGSFSFAASSPFGSGSLQLDIVDGSCSLPVYVMPVTLVPGAFPSGWLYGVDISIPELQNQLNVGFPFVGPLPGSIQIGPFTGLPTGLTFYAVAIGLNGALVPAGHSPALTYTIP